jgi:hypothetical protein
MGVDFDTCDTCGETTCDENITNMKVNEFGYYNTCSICRYHKKYFEPDEKSKENLLEEKSGYLFFACPKSVENPTKKDICFSTNDINQFKEFIKNGNYCVGFDDYPCFYYADEVKTMLMDAYDTFCHGKKDVFMNCGFEIRWDASENWKKLMKAILDDKIEFLQNKRRKFDK